MLQALEATLQQSGFETMTAASGVEGLKLAYEQHPDLILLDIIMPEMDGWEICRRLRQMTSAPIIMVTALGAEPEIVKGLRMGADDYLRKPCGAAELKARIEAVLRRATMAKFENTAVFDDGYLRVNLSNRQVFRKGRPVDLSPREFDLLSYLVRNRGKIISHQELLAHVWGEEYSGEVGYLSLYVSYLRKKIEEDPKNPRYIRTKWGIGYFFVDEDYLPEEDQCEPERP